MNRRELLKRSAALGLAAGTPSLVAGKLFAETSGLQAKSATEKTKPVSNPLAPPAHGSIPVALDRKSTRLNSSHSQISYAVFCLKKKKQPITEYKNNSQINPYAFTTYLV